MSSYVPHFPIEQAVRNAVGPENILGITVEPKDERYGVAVYRSAAVPGKFFVYIPRKNKEAAMLSSMEDAMALFQRETEAILGVEREPDAPPRVFSEHPLLGSW